MYVVDVKSMAGITQSQTPPYADIIGEQKFW